MKTLTFLCAFVLLTVSLIAQDAPMPQDIPLQQRNRPFDNPLDIQERVIKSFKPRIDDTQRRIEENQRKIDGDTNAEQRIQVLEVKVKNLEAEIAAQRALTISSKNAWIGCSRKISSPIPHAASA